MNSEIKRTEVTEIINDIKNHSDRLSEYDNVPLLELSAILSKINRLHETTVILKYLIARENHLEEVEFSSHTAISALKKGESESDISNLHINIPIENKSIELSEGEEIIVAMEVDESDDSTELEDGEEIIVEMEVDDIEQNDEVEVNDIEIDEPENSAELEDGEEIIVEIEVDDNEQNDEVEVNDIEIDESESPTELEDGEEIIVEMEVDDIEQNDEVEVNDIEIDEPENSTELEDGEEIIVEMEVDDNEQNDEVEVNDIEIDESESSTELEDGEEIIVEMEVDEVITDEEETANLEIDATIEEKEMIQQTLNSEQIENTPDLNEQYAEEKDNSVSKQLQEQAISDLVSSIGLNERYLYANELFKGDLDDFKSSLNHLNELENIEQATSYFWEELGEKFGWEKENELVKALYTLVERRFI